MFSGKRREEQAQRDATLPASTTEIPHAALRSGSGTVTEPPCDCPPRTTLGTAGHIALFLAGYTAAPLGFVMLLSNSAVTLSDPIKAVNDTLPNHFALPLAPFVLIAGFIAMGNGMHYFHDHRPLTEAEKKAAV